MNSTHGQTFPDSSSRINWQAITLVGGLALTICAVVGLGSLEKSRDGQTSPVAQSNVQTIGSVREDVAVSSPRPAVILVGSQEQGDAFKAVIAADEMAAGLAGNEMPALASVVVIDSPDKEYLREAVLADEMGSGAFEVIDLTTPAQQASSLPAAMGSESTVSASRSQLIVVSSQQQADALQAAMTADEMAAGLDGVDAPARNISFLVVDSPDKEYLYYAALADEMGSGTFEVMDLRN